MRAKKNNAISTCKAKPRDAVNLKACQTLYESMNRYKGYCHLCYSITTNRRPVDRILTVTGEIKIIYKGSLQDIIYHLIPDFSFNITTLSNIQSNQNKPIVHSLVISFTLTYTLTMRSQPNYIMVLSF